MMKKIISVGAAFCAAAMILIGGRGLTGGKDPLQPKIASKIMRFHVLANSDTNEDQELKLKVRDSVGKLMEQKLAAADGIKETEQIVSDSIPQIIETARKTLEENGCSDNVTAQITRTEFPVKTYGSYTFPAGEYEALQIVIGEGKGHNWWCVLYPNMCFRDSVYEVVDKESETALREVLTAEEYKDVFEGGNYEIRWKLLDYFR